LQHGNINHGLQRVKFSANGETTVYAPLAAYVNPLDAALALVVRDQVRKDRRRDEPIAYFQNTGPIGDLFAEARSRNRPLRIGVLGMGTGTLAGYAEPGWQIDYYEIDPAVPRIANNTNYFTYIPDAIKRGVKVETILGDGRLQIQKHAPDGAYDLIFMDAFSSDSVPVHLLTKEAVEIYLKKLRRRDPRDPDDRGGIIIVNIANRYLDFKPVFGNLAEELNLASMVGTSNYDWAADLFGCEWVFLAREKQDFGQLNEFAGGWHNNGMWTSLPVRPEMGVWKDDFSNLLGIFDWGRSDVKTREDEED
jgi:hypothetical protein